MTPDENLKKAVSTYLSSLNGFVPFPSRGTGDRQVTDLFVPPLLIETSGKLIELSRLDRRGARAIIVGGAGSGKTTLLQFLAIKATECFLCDSESHPCPVFIAATSLSHTTSKETVFENIVKVFEESTGAVGTVESFRKRCERGGVMFFIDGLDEIPVAAERVDLVVKLNDLARLYKDVGFFITSRPSSLSVPFEMFTYAHIKPFDTTQVSRFVDSVANQAPELGNEFMSVIGSEHSLLSLSSNPLLLTLMWSIFLSRGSLPTNRANLYSDFTDYLLSTWDRVRNVRRSAHVSMVEKTLLMEHFALHFLSHGTYSAPRNDLIEIAERVPGIDIDTATLILDEVLASGLLILNSHHNVSFVHRTFLEYFIANAVVNDPSRVSDFISRPELHEVIVVVCGLIVDVGPIIEAAIDKREILLAAKCVSHGRTHNRRLTEFVITSLIDEVGQPFVRLLVQSINKNQPVNSGASDEHSELLQLWDQAFEPGLKSHEKGSRFEVFSKALFSKFFHVVRHDLNTENGEIDLVLELIKVDPFWSDFGGEALVECKNWSRNTPLHEVGSFAHKASSTRGIKLAFFVSVSGFTTDALRVLKNQSADASKPLLVPIDGKEIKMALLRKDSFEEFFKEAVRDIKHLRKY